MPLDSVDALAALKAAIPDYAKDLRLNLGAVLGSTHLSEQQIWGTAVASAAAARSPQLTRAILAAAAPHLTPAALTAARTAAALMGMNNIYYRFTHLVGSDAYRRLPARLRMQAIANPGIPQADFELFSLAVSAVNGCGLCLESHERQLIAAGMSPEAVQDAVRIAAVLHGIAVALETEAAAAA